MNNNNKENIEQEKINKRNWWRNVGLWKTRHFAQNLKILAKVVVKKQDNTEKGNLA